MPTQEAKLITIREAAELLGVHPETLRRWDNEGKLKAVRVGERGHRRYNTSDVNRLMQGHTR
ncbi:MerR family transcriptional regulator [Patescibacteria group bacterium]|nr:MAG: MerR family transcriptional regulator [Patescibacteria group bacterium]